MAKVFFAIFWTVVVVNANQIIGLTPLSNINNGTGVVLSNGKSRVIIKNESFTKNTMYNGDTVIGHPKSPVMKINTTSFTIRHGISDFFDIRFIIPYIDKQKSFTNPNNQNRVTLKNKGLGDISAISRYKLTDQKKGDPFSFMVGAGIKFPTASTGKKFTDLNIPSGGGGALPLGYRDPEDIMDMQLGTGSADPLFEIGITKFLENSRWDIYAIHKFSQTGDHNFRFGDITKCGLGYSSAIDNNFFWQIEYNYHIVGKNIYAGTVENQTGGEFGYITPGIQYKVNKKIDLSFAYVKTVQRNNNYGTSRYEGVLGGISEDDRLIFRLGYNF